MPLGFDVLYLTPIHPIGRTNRKGRNNSLTATADDPGSPYAIGSAEGGHEAVHPQLGTLLQLGHSCIHEKDFAPCKPVSLRSRKSISGKRELVQSTD
jgi:hypothetical protein